LQAVSQTAKRELSNLDRAKSGFFKENGITGGFPESIYKYLLKHPAEVGEIAQYLLNAHFPDTIHEDILNAVGLNIEDNGIGQKTFRDPKFRDEILRAYQYRCAVCGFTALLHGQFVGLEAAHIKWHQAGGPDKVINGLCLCSLHHKLFDRGVFTLNDKLMLMVSESATGAGSRIFEELVLNFHGKQLLQPQNPLYFPLDKFLEWHVEEVFHGPWRYFNESAL
jgi:putative restriction endonuclease